MATSPIPKTTPSAVITPDKPKDTFANMIPKLLAGSRIARRAWYESAEIYIKDGLLYIQRKGVEHTLIVSTGDLLGEDWYVL